MPAPVITNAELNVLTVDVQEFLFNTTNTFVNVTDPDGDLTSTTFLDANSDDDIQSITISSLAAGSPTLDAFSFDPQSLQDYVDAYNAASTAQGGTNVITLSDVGIVDLGGGDVGIAIQIFQNGVPASGGQIAYEVTGIGTSSLSLTRDPSFDFIDTLEGNPINVLNRDIADAFLASVQVTTADSAPRDFQVFATDANSEVGALSLAGTPNLAPTAVDDAITLNEDDGIPSPVDLTALILANDFDPDDPLDDDMNPISSISAENIIAVTDTVLVTLPVSLSDPQNNPSPGQVLFTDLQNDSSTVVFTAYGPDANPNGVLSDFNFLDEGQSATITFTYTIDCLLYTSPSPRDS